MTKQFIRASAGTGKTHALLDTIFKYDKEKNPTVSFNEARDLINQSVFLTFANSAAEELRSRIYRGLSLCSGSPATDLTHALLEQNVHIRVYTIHAFALEMLRLFRYKLGLPEELNFTEDDEQLWNYCVQEFFTKNWNQKALRELLNISADDKVMCALLDVFFFLSDRRNIQEFIENRGDTLYFLAALGKSFCFDAPNHLEQAAALLKQNLSIDVDADYRTSLLKVRNELAGIKNRQLYKIGKQERENDIDKKEKQLAELKEKEENHERLTKTDQENLKKLPLQIEELKQELDQYLQELPFLQQLCPVLDMGSYFIEQIILAIGTQLYMPRMMSEGIFDFDAVVFLFIKELLRKDIHKFLRELEAEGQSFSRLYIDEAQDNDIIQNYLIVLFAQHECPVDLYVVGDLKQSIYTWRNAYPREFSQMLKECAATTNRSTSLTTLKTSRRLQAANTRDVINSICGIVQEAYKEEWWYDKEQDDLTLPDKSLCASDGKIEMWWSDSGGLSLATSNEEGFNQFNALDAFFASGKTAVAIRNRKQLSSVPDLQNKLQRLDANYKMDRVISDKTSGGSQPKAQTLQPELELFILLFMSLTEEQVEQFPFALFWSTAGKVLLKRLKLFKGGEVSAAFKQIFEKIYDDITKNVTGNRAERVLNLFDQYNLWTYLCHTDLESESQKPQDLRRTFYHILMRAQLAEDKHNRRTSRAFFSDPVWAVITKGKMPRSCYSLPQDPTVQPEESHPVPDVITIHGSKGRAYDNMIVVADFKKDFFGNTEDFRPYAYEEPYSQLFSADFKKILTSDPQMDIAYFPYLGLIPAYLLKHKDITAQNKFWERLTQNYTDTKKLIRSEQLNLLYVALTRTAKNLLLLDISSAIKQRQPDPEVQRIHQMFQQAGVEMHKISSLGKQTDETPAEIKYTYQDVPFERMDIGSRMPTRSVRSDITSKIYHKYGGDMSCSERFLHAKKGSMAHNVMQRLIGNAKDPADLAHQAQTLSTHSPNSLYAQAAKIVASNQTALDKLTDLLGKEYAFYHEVPVWQFDAQRKVLIKGSIDTLAVSEKKAVIVEYKVRFPNGQSQQSQAQEQMSRYEHILRALEQDYSIEKRAVELSE